MNTENWSCLNVLSQNMLRNKYTVAAELWPCREAPAPCQGRGLEKDLHICYPVSCWSEPTKVPGAGLLEHGCLCMQASPWTGEEDRQEMVPWAGQGTADPGM